jgi:3'(2'), 5'-bisphosphate nucleotidase
MDSILKNTNLVTAIHAALSAGKSIMAIYKNDIAVEFKSDNSPLTLADKEANTIINTYLKPIGIPIISEENIQLEYGIRKHWKQCWIVDPLDGTKEFIKRNGEFTVNIAFVESGQPSLGVIYIPASKTLYFADAIAKLAFKAELENHNTSLENVISKSKQIFPKGSPSQHITIIGSLSHMTKETQGFIEAAKRDFTKVTLLTKGSSLKFCWLAEGKAHIYPRFAPTMEWDTAAGHAICNAVDIDIISQVNHTPLRYNKADLYNPSFVAAKS